MMFPKKVVYLLLAYICLVTGLMEKNSLTFVIDSTDSMKDDIKQIKDSVNRIFDSVKNSEDSPIEDFILVTFNDKPSSVVFLTKTTDRKIFKGKLSKIFADGGGDCPESSLSGIKRGLEESRNGSFLYVFTDDVAGENDKVFSEVQNLAIRKKTQVVFIITRSKYCGEIETKSNYEYYKKLAEATNGNTFIMDKDGVEEILKDVSERIKNKQTTILSLELPAGYGHNVTIPIDAGMNDTMWTCTGTKADIHNITAPDGSMANSTTIVDLPSVITVKIPNPKVGNYTASVGSETETKFVAAAATTINFEYGFSPLEPTSMADTVTMPIKDVKSHIIVKIFSKETFIPSKIILKDKDNEQIENLSLKLHDATENIYITDKVLPPEELFKIVVFGYHEISKSNVSRESPTFIEVQKTETPKDMSPTMEIDKGHKINVKYNDTLKLVCKVEAYPKPDITWKDEDDNILTTEVLTFNLPYSYMAELVIEKVTMNKTYKCLATNKIDDIYRIINVVVERTQYLDILEKPEDTNIVYKNSDKIYCKVDALPPASITWHKNGAVVRSDQFVEISDAGDILIIKQMMPHLVGDYSCAATNGLESNNLGFKLSITGTEPRTSIAGPLKVNAEYNKPLFLRCQVEGYPKPKILWIDEKTGEELKSAPVAVPIPYDYGQEMQLEKVSKNATYKCVAKNDNGKHSSAVTVVQKTHFNVIKAPKDTNIVYKNSDKIYCKVDALPPASITWHKNGAVVRSDEFVEISDAGDILIIKQMMPHLVGGYSCAATNGLESNNLGFKLSIIGREPRTSIAGPLKVNAEYNKPLFLRCQVEGYPKPKILWIDEKTGEELKSAPVAVPIPYDYGQEMQLEKVSKNATYKCVAENDNGKHSSAVTVVTIQKIHLDIIQAPTNTAIKYKGEGQIFCKVDAYPSASIQWKFKGKPIKNSDHYDITSDGSTLRVTDMQPHLIGYYSCVVDHKKTHKKFNFIIRMSGTVKPKIDKSQNDIITIKEGSPVDIDCRIIKGTPPPTIIWAFQPDGGKKFGKVEDSSSSIHIKRVTPDDSGYYKCTASNVEGNDKHVVQVIVEFPPTIEKAEKQVDSKEGDKTTLLCTVHGYPQPTVVWSLNGAKITENGDYKIFRDYSLRFSASPSKNGKFTCTATNKHGTAKIETQVDYYTEIQFEPPDATIIKTFVGEKEKLECEAYGYPTPTITWLFHSSEAKLTEKPQVVPTMKSRPNELLLRILSTNQDGYYTCLASNKKTEKRLTFTVDVKEPAHIIRDTASTRPIKAVKGDLIRIPCQAVGKPKPSVTWFHNGYNIPTGFDSYSMDTDGALLIDNIIEGGDFYCDANNKLSASARELFKVDLEEYPRPTKIYATYSLEFGKPAVVECPITHKLTDLLRWYRNTELKVIGELKFYKVSYSDAGVYTCRVTDRISFKSESSSVKITVK